MAGVVGCCVASLNIQRCNIFFFDFMCVCLACECVIARVYSVPTDNLFIIELIRETRD